MEEYRESEMTPEEREAFRKDLRRGSRVLIIFLLIIIVVVMFLYFNAHGNNIRGL